MRYRSFHHRAFLPKLPLFEGFDDTIRAVE